MSKIRLILGCQLNKQISCLKDVEENDIILICEVIAEATYVKHHPKKIAFLFAAMRHFASELADLNYKVRYVKLDDPLNSSSFGGEVKRAIDELNIKHLIVTEPGEYRVKQMIESWSKLFNITVEIRADDRFLCSRDEFQNWAKNKKQLRMEYF